MSIFRMPSLGSDMEDGTLVEWLLAPGQQVRRGDIIAVVETQKGAIEIEVFENGRLLRYLAEIGATVPVGGELAEIDTSAGETADAIANTAAPSLAAPTNATAAGPGYRTTEATSKPTAPAPANDTGVAKAAAQPLRTPGALPAGAVAAAITPSAALPAGAPAGASADAAAWATGDSAAPVRASPAARVLAAEHHLDLGSLHGTGPDGAILRADVERALRTVTPRATPLADVPPPRRPSGGINVVEMRKAIAAAMARSKREIPHYYLRHTIDMQPALDFLASANTGRAASERILPGALIVQTVARALTEFPEFNGTTVSGFTPGRGIHVGVAISVRGGGLVAPAIHDANTLSIDALMHAMRDLVGRVRGGRLRASELADATVTVSSLGDRGVEALDAVIYPPQVAIFGAGTIVTRPWVDANGSVVARPLLTLSLAGDHRASDGHRGALLLRHIDALLQEPAR